MMGKLSDLCAHAALLVVLAACKGDPGAHGTASPGSPSSTQAPRDGSAAAAFHDGAVSPSSPGEAPAGAPAPLPRYCIPPGREELIQKGFAVAEAGAAGCRLGRASVQNRYIELEYVCGKAVSKLQARHPEDGTSDALLRTEKFALRLVGAQRPPEGTLKRLAAQIRQMEPRWDWIENCAQRSSSHEVGLDFYRSRDYRRAFEYFVEVVRKTPTEPGALRMIFASLEPQPLGLADVAALVKTADAAPGEPLPQLIAGLAAYAHARYRAADREERREAYQHAVRCLDRARMSYPFEPLVLVRLAVSQYRLGNQKAAEDLVDHAIRSSPTEPDPYFYGAEILQRTDVQRAIAYIDGFLWRMPVQFLSSPAGPRKVACVRGARDHLTAVAQAKTVPPGAWDLLAGESSTSGDVLRDCETFEQTISLENGLFDEWMLTESAARDREPVTQYILDVVAPVPGMKIADVGGGAGYYTFKLAKRVGPEGKVIATDTELRLVEHMRSYARAHRIDNVEVIPAEANSTRFSSEEIDLVLMVDSVDLSQVASHGERERALEYLRGLSRQLKRGGRVVYHRFSINNSMRSAVVDETRQLFFESGGYSTIVEVPLPQQSRDNPFAGESPGFTIVATR